MNKIWQRVLEIKINGVHIQQGNIRITDFFYLKDLLYRDAEKHWI